MASPSQTESPRANEDSETATVMPSSSTQQTGETEGTQSGSQQDKTEETDKKWRINASEVWDHFTKIGDGKRAVCNYCANSYASDPKKNGTSTMKGHMLNCTKGPYYTECNKDKKLLAFYKKQKHGEEEVCSNELVAVHWTKKGFRKALAKYIVIDELPFRHVEGEGLGSPLGT